MTAAPVLNTMVGIIAAVLISAAAYQANAVFTPVALALFIIAFVWPLQHRLQTAMPKLLALSVTIVVTMVVSLTFASLVAWGFGRVGRSLVADAERYQALYDQVVKWLEDQGISVAGLWANHFAFALNYIPFIGPFIATLFPTLFALTQFSTWKAALGVFVCLNIIQFVVGSYIEPRVSGNVLSYPPALCCSRFSSGPFCGVCLGHS